MQNLEDVLVRRTVQWCYNISRVLKLIIEDDEGRKTVVPFVRDEITIGRQEGNTIRLTERNVSRRHARLLRESVNVLIEDLGSYNGIKVNGDRITGQAQVQDGDLIQIGDYDLAIQREEEARSSMSDTLPLEPSRATTATLRLTDPGATMPTVPVFLPPEASEDDITEVPPPAEQPRHQSTSVIRIDQVEANRPQRTVTAIDINEAPRLVVLNTDFAGREFPCTSTELRIGRTDDNDIAIDHRSLSRTHCKLVREDSGEWKIIDLQSANGLTVNGEPYAQVTLRLGDVLELGHLKMKFVSAGDAVTVNSGTPTVSGENRKPSSKGPIVAVIATFLVIVLGGGGYVFLKGGGLRDPKPVRPVDPPPRIEPVGVVENPAVEIETAVELSKSSEIESEQKNEKLIADAEAAIGRGEFTEAEASLVQCKVGSSQCPKAQAMLAQISSEKTYLIALNEATTALEKGDLKAAGVALENARPTKLLRSRLLEIDRQRRVAVEALVAENANKPPVLKPVQTDPAVASDAAKKTQIEKFLADAKEAKKNGNFKTAIEILQKCLGVDSKNPECTLSLASTYATRGGKEFSEDDTKKARQMYEQFLKIAPPDHRLRARVIDILDGKN
jgi:ABC transport system ATP-binding/permease protein